MNIYRRILQDGIKQPIVLGLHRSDYMLHSVENDPRTFMQVELNTIASSFGALSSKVTFLSIPTISLVSRCLKCIESYAFLALKNYLLQIMLTLRSDRLQLHSHHPSSLPKELLKLMSCIWLNETLI